MTDTPDHAPAIAAFLLSNEARILRGSTGFVPVLIERHPGATREQLERGFAIAEEMLRADARVYLADADSLRRILRRLKARPKQA